MKRSSVAIRKSDLAPAFEAAKAAGFSQVSIVVETEDGKRLQITAGGDLGNPTGEVSPLEKWRAGRAQS